MRTGFGEDRQPETLAGHFISQHPKFCFDLDMGVHFLIRSHRDGVVHKVCDYFYELIERLDAEERQGEWGKIVDFRCRR